MTWNSEWPKGSVSVRANKTTGQQNTTYIETHLGNVVAGTQDAATKDHFWNAGTSLSGRHRYIQSPQFEIGGSPADPVMGSDMDACMFFRLVNSDVGRVEGFYKTADAPSGNYPNVYQFIPSFMSGTKAINSSFADLVTVPINVYGNIFLYIETAHSSNMVGSAIFQSDGTGVSVTNIVQSDSNGDTVKNFRFIGSNLTIRVRTDAAASGTWNYRITYRAK